VDLDCCYCMLDQPLLLVKEIKVHESVCENPFLDICILSSIYNIGLKYELIGCDSCTNICKV